MLHKYINSSILLSFGTSQRFNTSRGIRQGCPISPLLFILAVEYQIDKVIQLICLFSKASGLYLNINKCDLIAIHNSELDSLCNIPIKKSVKYLGITITRDSNQNIPKNLANNLLKAKDILNFWIQRDISIYGRIVLTKMELLSRFVYPASSLAIPPHLVKECNTAMFNFLWKNKHHYINKNDIVMKKGVKCY